MQIIHTNYELINILKPLKNIAFVPTMGNLHEGHLSLIQEAFKKTKYVVVSIFINPLQFNSNEDFKKYPRTLEEDLAMLKKIGVPFVFAPSESEMFDPLQTAQIHLIIAVDTVRHEDGLARSSRNSLLNMEDRKKAPQLFQTLSSMKEKAIKKNLPFSDIEAFATQSLNASGWIVDYLTIRSSQSLEYPVHDENQLVILGAATLGSVRLIDNIEFCIHD